MREAGGYSDPRALQTCPFVATSFSRRAPVIQTRTFGINADPEPTDLGVRGSTPLGRASFPFLRRPSHPTCSCTTAISRRPADHSFSGSKRLDTTTK